MVLIIYSQCLSIHDNVHFRLQMILLMTKKNPGLNYVLRSKQLRNASTKTCQLSEAEN